MSTAVETSHYTVISTAVERSLGRLGMTKEGGRDDKREGERFLHEEKEKVCQEGLTHIFVIIPVRLLRAER